MFDEVYVIAPLLSDVGTVIILTGVSPYVIDDGTVKVAAAKLLVALIIDILNA